MNNEPMSGRKSREKNKKKKRKKNNQIVKCAKIFGECVHIVSFQRRMKKQ